MEQSLNIKSIIDIVEYGGISKLLDTENKDFEYTSSSSSEDDEYFSAGTKIKYTYPKTFLDVIGKPYLRWHSSYPLKELTPNKKGNIILPIIVDLTKIKKILNSDLTKKNIEDYFLEKDLIPLLFKSTDTNIINISKQKRKKNNKLFRNSTVLCVLKFKIKDNIKYYKENIGDDKFPEMKDYKEYDEYISNKGKIAISYMISGRYFMVFENPKSKLQLDQIEMITIDKNKINFKPFTENITEVTGKMTIPILEEILNLLLKDTVDFK